MNKKRKMTHNARLQQLGTTLGMNKTDILQAKRTTKNIITMALVTSMLMIFGNMLMPSGPVGLYYGGGGNKDFRTRFGGLF